MFTLKSIDFKRVYLSREGALQDWNGLGALSAVRVCNEQAAPLPLQQY